MKNILIGIALIFPAVSFCQYYYNDILDARVTGEKMKNYTQQKVKTITATGYDARGCENNRLQRMAGNKSGKKNIKDHHPQWSAGKPSILSI